ncbi:hypothetical protein VNDN105_03680 [Mycobacterium tuberculosis]|nr:hypothetical protein VNDN105_03680 [Mycobacterium tuberculosis]
MFGGDGYGDRDMLYTPLERDVDHADRHPQLDGYFEFVNSERVLGDGVDVALDGYFNVGTYVVAPRDFGNGALVGETA